MIGVVYGEIGVERGRAILRGGQAAPYGVVTKIIYVYEGGSVGI